MTQWGPPFNLILLAKAISPNKVPLSFCKFRGTGGHQSVQGNVRPSSILQHPCLPFVFASFITSDQVNVSLSPAHTHLHPRVALAQCNFPSRGALSAIHSCCYLMPARFNLHSQADYSSVDPPDLYQAGRCLNKKWISPAQMINGNDTFFFFILYLFLPLTAVSLPCCTLGFL